MDLTSGSSRHLFQLPFANFRFAAAIAAVAAVAAITAFSPALGGMAVPLGATLLEGDGIRIGRHPAP